MKILKAIYYLSIATLIFWFLVTAILAFSPIEISGHLKYAYPVWRFESISLAILFTLAGSLGRNDTFWVGLMKVILTLIIDAFVVFVMVLAILGDMCEYSERQVLFQNRNDSSDKIVLRDFGCGATDSTPATTSIAHIKYFTPHIFIVKEKYMDTSTIDHSKWIRVQQEKAE